MATTKFYYKLHEQQQQKIYLKICMRTIYECNGEKVKEHIMRY